MGAMCSFGMLLGRICISAIFIMAGVHKFMDSAGTAAYMASKGMTMVPLFLYGSAIVEILGGLSVLVGYKIRWGAILLLLYLIPTTLIFHDFWNATEMKEIQMAMFFKNLAIFGGLLFVISCGAGGCSCDACVCCSKGETPKG